MVIEQLARFIEHAFEADGGCLEGIGYWNYGLIHYVAFAEMLRARTDGAIDLLDQEKIRTIARYPAAVMIGPQAFASFADSHESSSVRPFLAARLGARTGATGLRGLVGDATTWRLTGVLRNLLWWDGAKTAAPPLENVLLPVSGVARLVGPGDVPLVLAAKAGHNNEPHNHNDVGSFIVRVGETTYLCDPGGGLYTKDYFGAGRYKNVFVNSYGHSVPRIGGALQAPGGQYKGALTQLGPSAVQVTFHEAYNVPGIEAATRTFAVAEGQATLEDVFTFEDGGLAVEEAFVTWQSVELEGRVARIVADTGVLTIEANAGTFAAERLEEACEANGKHEVLTRLTVDYPAAAKTTARFTMTFEPAGSR